MIKLFLNTKSESICRTQDLSLKSKSIPETEQDGVESLETFTPAS